MLVALHAKMVGTTQRIEYKRGGRNKDRAKSVSLMASAISASSGKNTVLSDADEEEREIEGIERAEQFFQEFTRICVANLYPGGPIQRQVIFPLSS